MVFFFIKSERKLIRTDFNTNIHSNSQQIARKKYVSSYIIKLNVNVFD